MPDEPGDVTGAEPGSAAHVCDKSVTSSQTLLGHGPPTLIIAASFGQPGTMQTMLPTVLKAGHRLVFALAWVPCLRKLPLNRFLLVVRAGCLAQGEHHRR